MKQFFLFGILLCTSLAQAQLLESDKANLGWYCGGVNELFTGIADPTRDDLFSAAQEGLTIKATITRFEQLGSISPAEMRILQDLPFSFSWLMEQMKEHELNMSELFSEESEALLTFLKQHPEECKMAYAMTLFALKEQQSEE